MSSMSRLLILLLLIIGAFAAVDYFLMDRVLLTRLVTLVSPPPATTRDMAFESAEWLDQAYRADPPYPLEDGDWSLRTFIVAGDDLRVVVDYPAGAASQPPTYSEIMQLCPIAGAEDYWEQSFAQPFTIYLSDYGDGRVQTMARCDRSFDFARYEIVTGQAEPDPATSILPREGESSDDLEAAASDGDPSFEAVSKMLHREQLRDVEDALRKRSELVRLYDEFGHTLLYDAQSPEAVRMLIGYGAEPNVSTRNGEVTPLQWLAETGASFPTLEAMVRNGAQPGRTHPGSVRNPEIVEFLLDGGAPVSGNALFDAIASYRFDVADLLFERGADINTTTSASPLHYLASQTRRNVRAPGDSVEEQLAKNIEAFRRAVRYGADPDRREADLTIREYLEANRGWAGRDRLLAILEAGQ